MKRLLSAALVLCALVLSPAIHAGIIEDLSRNPEVLDAQISPKGDYLAVIREENDKRIAVIFNFPAMTLSSVMSFPGRNEVQSIQWVNDERLLARVSFEYERWTEERNAGEYFAMNADGSKSEHVFGFRAADDDQGRGHVKRKRNEWAAATVVDPLWDDPKHVLIEMIYFSAGFDNPVELAKLNVYNGRIRNRVRAPVPNSTVLVDKDGEPRFAYSINDNQDQVIHKRDKKSKKWEVFTTIPYGETGVSPISFHEDGRVYAIREPDGKPRGVYLMNVENQEYEEVFQHELVDARTVADFDDVVYGVYYEDGIPDFVPVEKDHPLARLRMSLKKAFPDRYPYTMSSSHDFKTIIAGVRTDYATTEIYVYDAESNQLQLLFDTRPWIDDSILGTRDPIMVTARDGVELHGYLSLPTGSDGRNLPTIIVPHGGPHGPRDEWSTGWESFIPASGYAMLQINYRGSGGYGTEFEKSGFREWAGKMQDDLTDTVKWAIEEGITDPERVCIFGWSYGGFAAAMAISHEPDLYKCSVAGAGVYDQDEQYANADFADQTRWGRKYMDRVIGPTQEDRIAASPMTYVDKIKTPMLLIHGEEDVRVPIEHAYNMIKAFEQAGKTPPKLIELKNEPHGPRNAENIALWYQSTIDFFEKHIGPGVPLKKGGADNPQAGH